MDTSKVYLDTCILLGSLKWLLENRYQYKSKTFLKFFSKERKEKPYEMVFFNEEHKEVKKYCIDKGIDVSDFLEELIRRELRKK